MAVSEPDQDGDYAGDGFAAGLASRGTGAVALTPGAFLTPATAGDASGSTVPRLLRRESRPR